MSTETHSAPAYDPDHPFGAPPKDLPRLADAKANRATDRSGIEILTVDLTNASDRTRFMDVAAPIYRNDPNY
ncbi:MAG: hypothetical protein HC923_05820, partial [Myxococcales bacterium]|nr:hypothetical protein [Myxococcales bacterium]